MNRDDSAHLLWLMKMIMDDIEQLSSRWKREIDQILKLRDMPGCPVEGMGQHPIKTDK